MQSIQGRLFSGIRTAALWVLLLTGLVPAIGQAATPVSANEQVIRNFIGAMDHMMATHDASLLAGIMNQYWTQDCIQHHGRKTLDRAQLLHSIASLLQAPQSAASAQPQAPFKTVLLTSFDDRVLLLRRRVTTDAASDRIAEAYVYNIYRLRDGRIAENWWGLSLP